MTQSTNQSFDLAAAMKSQQWERAKGELRALVALQGSHHAFAGYANFRPGQPERLAEVKSKVEAFIKDIEGEGLAE